MHRYKGTTLTLPSHLVAISGHGHSPTYEKKEELIKREKKYKRKNIYNYNYTFTLLNV